MTGNIFSPRSYPRLETTYSHHQIPILESTVHLFQSPETRACIVGGLKFKDGQFSFRLGRQHLNGLRNLDLDLATHLLMMSPEFKESIKEYDHKTETIGTMLLREPIAQNPFLNSSLANINTPLYMILDVHHIEDVDGIKGKSGKVSHYRLDMPTDPKISAQLKTDIKHAIMVDSIAGGRNLLAAIEELKSLFNNLEKITVVSVFGTEQGIKRISQTCQTDFKLKTEFFVFHELLDVSPINEYDCFYPPKAHDDRDSALMKLIWGEDKYRKICVGGDFTANIYGRLQAKTVWDEQLKNIGLKNSDLPINRINTKVLKELGYQLSEILPYSSIWVATEQGLSMKELAALY